MLSRPWASLTNASERSGRYFTARFSLRDAQVHRACSGYRKIFMPKPPPTSVVRQRSFAGSILRTASASSTWNTCGPWVEDHRVERSVDGSYSATTGRTSIELTTMRLFTIRTDTALWAFAKAASTAALSPLSQSNARLLGMWSNNWGAPSATAASVSTVASSSSYSTSMSSTASRA